jgi:exopolysaccharide biosynthesis polyprenyl glycosylphosphotransferase
MPAFDSKTDYLRHLLQVLDLVIVACTYIAAMRAYPLLRQGESIDVTLHLGLLPLILILFAISRLVIASDVEIHGHTLREQIACIVKEVLFTLGAIGLIIFLLKLDGISRLVLVGFGAAAILTLIVMRQFIIWFYFRRKAGSTDHFLKVLIIGSGRRARMLADQMQRSSAWGVDIVGFLDPTGESAGRRSTDSILGHINDITQVLRDNIVEDVIVAVPRSMLGDVQSIIDACQEEGVRLRFMADFYDFEAARVHVTEISGIPLLSFEPVARGEGALLAKRIFDLVATLAVMPVFLPLMLIVALAIKFDSRGPVFFMQDRVGLHKRQFKMFKFRSMVADAEARMNEVEHLNEADGPNFKIENDPRITRVGRFIRKTSIDELPQLFNVVLGDMSLVGPRPMSRRDVALFDKGSQRKRFSVRPGITCLWQISGRSDLSFDEWLRLDLQYIDTWTFWLDFKILLQTVPTVLRGRGAV